MPLAPSPLRLDAELVRSAARAASHMSRSVSDQIAHWARIGRELERSAEVSVADVDRVLAGAASYDALRPAERSLVRAAWLERMRALGAGLRLDRELAAAGVPYAELDDDGKLVVREPAAPSAAVPAAAALAPSRRRSRAHAAPKPAPKARGARRSRAA